MFKQRLSAVILECALCILSETGLLNMNQEKALLTQSQALIEERKYPQAIGLLFGIADNEDAAKLLDQLYYVISGVYIENLDVGVAEIDREGHVRLMAHPVYFENLYAGQEETLKKVGEYPKTIRRVGGGRIG